MVRERRLRITCTQLIHAAQLKDDTPLGAAVGLAQLLPHLLVSSEGASDDHCWLGWGAAHEELI